METAGRNRLGKKEVLTDKYGRGENVYEKSNEKNIYKCESKNRKLKLKLRVQIHSTRM